MLARRTTYSLISGSEESVNRAYADVVFTRVEREMLAAPAPKVKLVHTKHGCYANAKLQEQAKCFLTRAAKRKP